MDSDDLYSENLFNSPDTKQLALWSLRLANNPAIGAAIRVDPHLFGLFYASTASAVDPPESLLPKRAATVSDNEQLLGTLKELQRQFGRQASGHFAKLYMDGVSVYDRVLSESDKAAKALEEWEETAKSASAGSINSLEANVDRLTELLDLSEIERNLLIFQLIRDRPGFGQLFDVLLEEEVLVSFVLGAMFKLSSTEVMRALDEKSTLVQSGLLAVDTRPLRISTPSPHLKATLFEEASSDEEFFDRFVKPLEPEATTSSLARLHEKDEEILLKLIKRSSMPKDTGAHMLVYGPPSIDKIDMLARLFEKNRVAALAVRSRKVPSEDMPAWVCIAQRRVEETEPDSVLVIDRTEQALAQRISPLLTMFGLAEEAEEEDRASDAGLTESPVRCVWLTDHAASLSERNIGRFLFHCEALPGSRGDRKARVEQVLDEFELSDDLRAHLSSYALLGEKPVRNAAKLANLIARKDTRREEIIKRAVHQSQRAIGREQTEDLRDSITSYSLDYLNINGRFTPQQIVKALEKRRKGTLCFYGIPGAGKTQLAEYLAVELDLPILSKRASDILSKWLGESEQNIASMFKEAEAEGALLFLDEADSFLRDRSLARAEWSVTQVNELLQHMERFDGVFIAATNLFKDIDAAALRRFTWKMEFLEMTDDQAWKMFVAESGFEAKDGDEETSDYRERLAQIDNLTPGDFATVKRQAVMLEEELTPSDWIEQLAVEAKAKMAGLTRHGVGFSNPL